MPTAKSSATANRRATLIKLIHVAKRELRLDDPTYRTILASVGTTDSLSSMSVPNMINVLEHLKKQGFQVRARVGDRRQAKGPFANKVRALWLFLHALGVVRDPSEKALNAYIKRIAKVDDLHWVPVQDEEAVIETLKKWAMRFLPAEVARLQSELIAHLQRNPAGSADLSTAQLVQRPGSDEGFDSHWQAWERFMSCLNRTSPVPPSAFTEEN